MAQQFLSSGLSMHFFYCSVDNNKLVLAGFRCTSYCRGYTVFADEWLSSWLLLLLLRNRKLLRMERLLGVCCGCGNVGESGSSVDSSEDE